MNSFWNTGINNHSDTHFELQKIVLTMSTSIVAVMWWLIGYLCLRTVEQIYLMMWPLSVSLYIYIFRVALKLELKILIANYIHVEASIIHAQKRSKAWVHSVFALMHFGICWWKTCVSIKLSLCSGLSTLVSCLSLLDTSWFMEFMV